MKSKSLSLRLYENCNEITLPDWIGECSMTLAEIGAVACIASFKSNNSEGLHARLESKEMQDCIVSLRNRGVFDIKINEENKSLIIHCNLDPVTPERILNA